MASIFSITRFRLTHSDNDAWKSVVQVNSGGLDICSLLSPESQNPHHCGISIAVFNIFCKNLESFLNGLLISHLSRNELETIRGKINECGWGLGVERLLWTKIFLLCKSTPAWCCRWINSCGLCQGMFGRGFQWQWKLQWRWQCQQLLQCLHFPRWCLHIGVCRTRHTHTRYPHWYSD